MPLSGVYAFPPVTFLASERISDLAHADASKLRDDAAFSMTFFSSSVHRKRKYVDFALSGSFLGLAIKRV
jgi:hypothetical protein